MPAIQQKLSRIYRRSSPRPRSCLLQLRGQTKQSRFITKTRGKLHSYRDAVGCPVQRQGNSRLPGGIKYRREWHIGEYLARPLHGRHLAAILIQLTKSCRDARIGGTNKNINIFEPLPHLSRKPVAL